MKKKMGSSSMSSSFEQPSSSLRPSSSSSLLTGSFPTRSNTNTKKLSKEKLEKDKKVCKDFNLKTNESKGRKITKRRSIFDLRTSKMRTSKTDDDLSDGSSGSNPGGERNMTGTKQGRLYDTRHAYKPGGLIVDEMIYGIKMAHLSCTDDSDTRLVGSSANSIAALVHLVEGNDMNGSPIEHPEIFIKLKLSEILKQKFSLNLDCWIDESGVRKGRPVDTQGYIASNEDIIILSYRFSTSLFDWIANFNIKSSEWEPAVDEALGHAGLMSSCGGWFTKFCTTKEGKPRVHTSYYNNFIYTIPMIREHIINKLMKKDGTPKKVYVVGCSLGAAISQIAFCFILEEMTPYLKDPNFMNHKLISVTAGCPRVGDRKFRKVMMKRMALLKPLNRAVICRCVYNNDIVPHAPPNVLKFHHLDKLVYITKNGDNLIINPNMSKIFTKFGELQKIYTTLFNKKKVEVTENVEENIHKAQDTIHEVQDNIAENIHEVQDNIADAITKKEGHQRISSGTAASDVVAAVAKGNAEEEKEKRKTAFEIECEHALEGIHDHMPYWYMTFLEKIRDEQNAMFSSDNDAAVTPATSNGNNHGSDLMTSIREDPAKEESAPQETESDGDDGVDVAAC
ncbi:alpha/beta-hydrolase [Fragilariopsis cylindrus CCMP1102]|uniref:Alpha/beta-hydrolase n=1 Tax=Fragilariopsis cylindrus CCMP1102 TaxID=635003 RepID=A0A1E7ENC3_9STRA|nr:alpha/beta-hydrolase [Fragilariopsis cylindrus CCMP1102]|eukprot:OEU07440.1 alpha/beta-hydrolase [Fragilariopsis cylindrus CCMP1102]